jgi:hypothetical protein
MHLLAKAMNVATTAWQPNAATTARQPNATQADSFAGAFPVTNAFGHLYTLARAESEEEGQRIGQQQQMEQNRLRHDLE